MPSVSIIVRVDYSDSSTYEVVADKLKEKEAGHLTSSNRLIYLSTPPSLYGEIIREYRFDLFRGQYARLDKDRHRETFWKRS